MILGIDFGNCFSSIAVMVGDEPVTDFLEDSTGQGFPSCFLYYNGKEYYGDNCYAGNLPHGEIISRMKKELRAKPGNLDLLYTSGGRSFPMRKIVRKYLEYIIVKVQNRVLEESSFNTDKNIEEVTITAPVAIGNNHELASTYRELLQTSICEITGLPESKVHVFDEPAAAALSYLYSNPRKQYENKQTILVFDLGGGTLDIVLLEHNPRNHNYKILDREGDLDLGGDDWDNALSKLVSKSLGITSFNNAEEEFEFANEITKLKIGLTDSDRYPFKFKINGRPLFVDISRSDFEEATKDLLARALDKLESVIDHFDKGLDGIDKIVLSGGSSNMPQIRKGIVERLGIYNPDNIVSWDPSRAIAKGAALHARIQSSCDYGVRENIQSKVPHTYGIATYISAGEAPVVSNLLFKGTTFTTSEYSYKTPYTIRCRKGKSFLEFEVYESDVGRTSNPQDDTVSLEDTVYSGIKMIVTVPEEYTNRENEFRVKIKMTITTDGILTVSAYDARNDKFLGTVSRD